MSFQTSSMVLVTWWPSWQEGENGEADEDEDVDEIDFEEEDDVDDDEEEEEEPLWRRLLVLFKLKPSSPPAEGTMNAC